MNERIKKLRKALGFTQQEFAQRLNVGRGTLANYEVGRNEPIDAVVSLICREFNVSETWLRTGEGEMFIQRSREDELAEFMDRLLQSEPDDIRRRFVSAISRLSTSELEILEKVATGLVEEIPKQDKDTAYAVPPIAPALDQTPQTSEPIPNLAAELAELKRQNQEIMRQNQEMAAEIAAINEEDAALERSLMAKKSPFPFQ